MIGRGAVADPFLAKALPYWQQIIDTYAKDAYLQVMSGQITSIRALNPGV